MLRGLLLVGFVRGLALDGLPLGLRQPIPDGGLFLRSGPARLTLGLLQLLTPVAVVQHPVDHPVVILQGHLGGAERVLRLRRQGDDLSVQADELLRLLEVFRVLLHLFRGQRGEAVLTQPHHQEGAGHDVVNLPMLIPQASVQLQADELALIVADQPHRVREGISGGNVAAHLRL